MTACSRPVFIGGCPRSGTTALWNALSTHPNLAPGPGNRIDKELWFFTEFFAGRDDDYIAHRNHDLDRIFLSQTVRFINDFMCRHCSSPTGRYISGHPHNIRIAKHLMPWLPSAKFVFVIRHPQENVWSMVNAPFAAAAGWRIGSQASITVDDIKTATLEWKASALPAIKALCGEFAGAVLVVRHEDLVQRPKELVTTVLSFLDEPFSQSVVDKLAGGIVNSSFSPGDSLLQVDSDDARHLYYQRIRNELAREEAFCRAVVDLVGAEMQALGYEDLLGKSEPVLSSPSNAAASEKTHQAIGIVGTWLKGADGERISAFAPEEPVVLVVQIRALKPIENVSVGFLVRRDDDLRLFGTTTFDENVKLPRLGAGETWEVTFRFSQVLPTGRFYIDVWANTVTQRHYLDNVVHDRRPAAVVLEALTSPVRPVHNLFHNPTITLCRKLPSGTTG